MRHGVYRAASVMQGLVSGSIRDTFVPFVCRFDLVAAKFLWRAQGFIANACRYYLFGQLRWLKYFYMTTTPAQSELQYPMFEPSYEDFMDSVNRRRILLKAVASRGTQAANPRIFAMSETYKLPLDLQFNPRNLRTTGKNAGVISNHVMCAATALVLALPNGSAAGVENAWQGAFVVCLEPC